MEKTTRNLVSETLGVMNRSITRNEDSFPYKQILQLSEKALHGKRIGIAVYRDDAKHPHDFYTAEFNEGRLSLLGRGKEDVSTTWTVSEDYLKKVAGDPEPYIEHPEKLDWEWLRDRLGI